MLWRCQGYCSDDVIETKDSLLESLLPLLLSVVSKVETLEAAEGNYK